MQKLTRELACLSEKNDGHNVPFGNQTWLAGKIEWVNRQTKLGIFQLAMFDSQKL
jgi:hypothetical protein